MPKNSRGKNSRGKNSRGKNSEVTSEAGSARLSPNFSQILENGIITQQAVRDIKKIEWTDKKRIKRFNKERKERGQEPESSTAQDHIISDYWLQGTLWKVGITIKNLQDPNPNEVNKGNIADAGFLAAEMVKALDIFLSEIFHVKETKELAESKRLFQVYLQPVGSEKDLKKFCMHVPSAASNNAVIGNGNVNSGIKEKMDAPVDSRGRLLPEFDKIRESYLKFTEVVSRTIDNKRNVALYVMVLETIKPDYIAGGVRASSSPYKYGRDPHTGHSEAPPVLDNPSSSPYNFHSSSIRVPIKTKKAPSEPQMRHIEAGYVHRRLMSCPSPTEDYFTSASLATPAVAALEPDVGSIIDNVAAISLSGSKRVSQK